MPHRRSHPIMSRRCDCGKLGKDIIEGVPKCRVCSPMRQAFAEKLKEKKK